MLMKSVLLGNVPSLAGSLVIWTGLFHDMNSKKGEYVMLYEE